MEQVIRYSLSALIACALSGCGNEPGVEPTQASRAEQGQEVMGAKYKDKTYLEAVYCSAHSDMLAGIIPQGLPDLKKWGPIFAEIATVSRSDAFKKATSENNPEDEISNLSLRTAYSFQNEPRETAGPNIKALLGDTFSKCSAYAKEETLKTVL